MTFSVAIEQLREALVSRILTGADELPGIAGLLALDPDDSTPAMYVGNKNQAPPVYPCLTYRVSNGAPDNSMRSTDGGLAGNAIRLRLEFEVWTASATTGAVAGISGPIESLLHNKGFDLAACRCFRTLFVMCQPDLYDKAVNAYYGLYAYELHLQLP